jgi:hypothetical protein
MVRHTGEDFIDKEGVAVAMVLPLQSAGINGTELYTPEADCFSAKDNSSFCEQIFDIAVAEIEAVVQPDGVTDNVRRESMAFVGVHSPIIPFGGVNLAVPYEARDGKLFTTFDLHCCRFSGNDPHHAFNPYGYRGRASPGKRSHCGGLSA